MKSLKSLLVLAFAALSINAAAKATYTDGNTQYTDHGYWFLQFQGGFGYTFGNGYTKDQISPAAQFAVGYQFNHVWGLRLGVNGWQGRGGWKNQEEFPMIKNAIADGIIDTQGPRDNMRKYKWYYLAPSIDVKFNIINAIAGYNPNRVFGLNIIAGVGANIAWDHAEMANLHAIGATAIDCDGVENDVLPHADIVDGTSVYPVGRVGLDADFRLSKRVSLNLESVFNLTSDHWNGKHGQGPDCYVNTLAGVKVNIGKVYTTTDLAPVYQTVIDTTWYDDTQYKTLTQDGTMTWNVFYKIRESNWEDQIDNDANAQLAAIGKFLAAHKECKISMKSYADAETGNAKLNMDLSKDRSDKAVAALEGAGVSSSIITAEYFGDTVQPFPENDKNRCTIITATGLVDYKQPYTVKKFRTTERQVRIN